MPSYFYHLKFELYPCPSSDLSFTATSPSHDYPTYTSAASIKAVGNTVLEGKLHKATERKRGKRSKQEEEDRRREIWIPPPGANIFDTEAWPAHPPVPAEPGSRSSSALTGHLRSESASAISTAAVLPKVIDCGPLRGSLSEYDPTGEENVLIPISGQTQLEFPPPNPGVLFEQRDLGTAQRDWRFGTVRVESLDMDMDPAVARPGQRRGESSSALAVMGASEGGGINAGVAAGGTGLGRVTKARFEGTMSGEVQGKNTEVGWGVVHLYRDGEESAGLGRGEVEVYNSRNGDGEDVVAGEGSIGKREEKETEEDGTILCIPAVPSYLTPSDFLGFVGEKTREEVSHFRMVMTGRMNRYLVLMKFRDGGAARRWRAEWDGKVFNSMEPETCHVTFIKSITFQTPHPSQPSTSFPELSHDPFTPPPNSNPSTHLKPFPPPTANLVELPTCPVCLERMDSTTGLLTILCQHVFHCACLQKWKGSGCPVCRHTSSSPLPYDPTNPPITFGSGEASLCTVCDSVDDLWICLICGNVGCGRYKGGHAKEHWKDSAHNFALEIETQHVWDYAGDMWVHRLIRDKGDGKVVEMPHPSSNNLNRPPVQDGGDENGFGRYEEVEMVPRSKLENIGMEYTHLLTSQLESQRVYFEELVSKAAAKASAASSSASLATSRADEALSRLRDLEIENKKLREETIVTLEKDLAREKKKAEKSSEVARSLSKSLLEEKKVGEGLLKRIEHINTAIGGISQELSAVKERNEELKEENRDLLFSITAGEKLKTMEGGEGLEEGELEGGTVGVPEGKGKRRGKGKGK